MKRCVMLSLIAVLLLAANICSAARLPDADYALGGIKLGDSADFVKSVYGEPEWVKRHEGTPGSGDVPLWIYHYGDSFVVGVNAETMHVVAIMTSMDNGIETPRGIHVGSTLTDLQRAYGSLPRAVPANGGYQYSFGWAQIKLVFYVDKKGRIYEISTDILDIG